MQTENFPLPIKRPPGHPLKPNAMTPPEPQRKKRSRQMVEKPAQAETSSTQLLKSAILDLSAVPVWRREP